MLVMKGRNGIKMDISVSINPLKPMWSCRGIKNIAGIMNPRSYTVFSVLTESDSHWKIMSPLWVLDCWLIKVVDVDITNFEVAGESRWRCPCRHLDSRRCLHFVPSCASNQLGKCCYCSWGLKIGSQDEFRKESWGTRGRVWRALTL